MYAKTPREEQRGAFLLEHDSAQQETETLGTGWQSHRGLERASN